MSAADAEHLVAVAVAELRRQEETSGCSVHANGDWAQVDGSFDLRKVIEACCQPLRHRPARGCHTESAI
jgi:hypothetical protein